MALSTKEKSVQINLHSNYYGTVAEIGGGQETARHLFQAGGASNTVAKTISAYDKLFSDHYYSKNNSERYVSEARLRQMIDHEYGELLTILDKKNEQKFFAFANTVETINYSKTNLGKGWLGIAIEGSNRHAPNYLAIHIKLHENDTLLQQYTLGTLGINLIYGSLFFGDDPRKVLLSLLDNLDADRVEIDYVWTEGPDMHWVDNRLLNLMLVSNNMTPAIIFDKNGRMQQAGDMLYKKNVLLMRGYFRPITKLGLEFLENSFKVFKRDEDYTPENTLSVCELSLKYLIENEELNEKDFLHRVDLLNMSGQNVMVSNYDRYFELVDFFAQFKLIKLRIALGMPTFVKLFDDNFYADLKGKTLEALGAIFQHNVKLYLYPTYNYENKTFEKPSDDVFDEGNKLLWRYLLSNGKVILLDSPQNNIAAIGMQQLTRLIETDNVIWENYVPNDVCKYIRMHKLFGLKH